MKKLCIIAASAAMSLLLAACGGSGSGSFQGSSAGGGSQTGNGGTTTPTPVYSMGKGSGSGFQAGAIDLAVASLAAGGTTGMQVSIVDQNGTLYSGTAVTISFNSPCFAAGQALIAATGTSTGSSGQVTTSTGIASATYTAKGCAGSDVVTATAAVGSSTLTASGTVTIAAATAGSVQFTSATPASIGLKGTGLGETSTVVFTVVDGTGGPRPNITVNFALNSTTGGMSLTPPSAVSAADGTVRTTVKAGTVHTSVRVTATIPATGNTPELSTQSSVLAVTTGLPASKGFSMAVGKVNNTGPACPNVEAYDIDGQTVPLTVRLSDRYNNPAPDGTSVTFTTNGGHVVGSCVTPSAPGAADGTCSVNWTSANPRPQLTDDNPNLLRAGRATVLATAIGEESFTDNNGNGFYDQGEAFVNLGEPYEDDNENGTYEVGEHFLDFNHSGSRDAADNTFKGITCTGSDASATCSTTTLAISQSAVIVMSTSAARITVTGSSPVAFSGGGLTITHGTSTTLTYNFTDTNGNPMAAGTTASIAVSPTSLGTVTQAPANPYTLACTVDTTPVPLTASFSAAGGSGNIIINVTSPSGLVTPLVIPVTVN